MNPIDENRIFSINDAGFESLALEVFNFQACSNPVYSEYLHILKIKPGSVKSINSIPFLPISFFKTRKLLVKGKQPQIVFSSSGTTGVDTSMHYVASTALYEKSFYEGFRLFYGEPSQYCILALLPSYLEREGSSLVYMVKNLIELSGHPQSGFFLHNTDDLVSIILENEKKQQKTIVLGVTFALLELSQKFKADLKYTTIMETGGMKGRGKELIRNELHFILKNSFGVKTIHSEYGMTELLSQAYSMGEGIFKAPPWMRVVVRDPYDPFTILPNGRSGALNIIDLANIFSCSFIQTDDLGIVHSDGTFEVLGRMDGSQLRGCNLLV